HTPGVEPESAAHDREAMLADRRAVTERLEREVEASLASAAARRRAFEESTFDRLRYDAGRSLGAEPVEPVEPAEVTEATRMEHREEPDLEARIAAADQHASEIVAWARADADRILTDALNEAARLASTTALNQENVVRETDEALESAKAEAAR